jgi:hypothetical protein
MALVAGVLTAVPAAARASQPAVAPTSADTASTPFQHDFYWIVNEHSDRCLNVTGASTADLARIIQFTCQGNYTNDRWYIEDTGWGFFHIINENSRKCLNVSGASTADLAPVIQFTCSYVAFDNDDWYFDGSFIKNGNSGKCLNVSGASTADLAPVIQFTCQYVYDNDKWAMAYSHTGF